MAVVRYDQDKLLNRDNGNFVKTNETWKHSIEIWRDFVLSDGFVLYFD